MEHIINIYFAQCHAHGRALWQAKSKWGLRDTAKGGFGQAQAAQG